MAAFIATSRERLLSLATGAGAGAALTFYMSRQVWVQAHDAGCLHPLFCAVCRAQVYGKLLPLEAFAKGQKAGSRST